jgi:hypothetical protein
LELIKGKVGKKHEFRHNLDGFNLISSCNSGQSKTKDGIEPEGIQDFMGLWKFIIIKIPAKIIIEQPQMGFGYKQLGLEVRAPWLKYDPTSKAGNADQHSQGERKRERLHLLDSANNQTVRRGSTKHQDPEGMFSKFWEHV